MPSRDRGVELNRNSSFKHFRHFYVEGQCYLLWIGAARLKHARLRQDFATDLD